MGKVVCPRSFKTKNGKRLIAVQARHDAFSLHRHIHSHLTHIAHAWKKMYIDMLLYIYGVYISQRYAITILQINISELKRYFCQLEVHISQHQNCKGHYNDITLFRGWKSEMSTRSAATSSCKWSRMLALKHLNVQTDILEDTYFSANLNRRSFCHLFRLM